MHIRFFRSDSSAIKQLSCERILAVIKCMHNHQATAQYQESYNGCEAYSEKKKHAEHIEQEDWIPSTVRKSIRPHSETHRHFPSLATVAPHYSPVGPRETTRSEDYSVVLIEQIGAIVPLHAPER